MKNTNKQTIGEEIANAISHGIMAIFGIVATILLLIKAQGFKEIVSVLIFGLSIIILYTMSTIYHALHHKGAKRLFKRFDHLSIYILIGGTFAPFLINVINEPVIWGITLGIWFLIIQWTLIIIGIVFKSIWINKFSKLHVVIYLLLGWSALVFGQTLFSVSSDAFWYVVFGGIAYSIGVIFYAFPKIKYFHFVWHIFVAIGTILQFIAIYGYVI